MKHLLLSLSVRDVDYKQNKISNDSSYKSSAVRVLKEGNVCSTMTASLKRCFTVIRVSCLVRGLISAFFILQEAVRGVPVHF